jgi:hypothetical protein
MERAREGTRLALQLWNTSVLLVIGALSFYVYLLEQRVDRFERTFATFLQQIDARMTPDVEPEAISTPHTTRPSPLTHEDPFEVIDDGAGAGISSHSLSHPPNEKDKEDDMSEEEGVPGSARISD